MRILFFRQRKSRPLSEVVRYLEVSINRWCFTPCFVHEGSHLFGNIITESPRVVEPLCYEIAPSSHIAYYPRPRHSGRTALCRRRRGLSLLVYSSSGTTARPRVTDVTWVVPSCAMIGTGVNVPCRWKTPKNIWRAERPRCFRRESDSVKTINFKMIYSAARRVRNPPGSLSPPYFGDAQCRPGQANAAETESSLFF